MITAIDNKKITIIEIAETVRVSNSTIERDLLHFKEKQIVKYIGNKRSGYWLVNEKFIQKTKNENEAQNEGQKWR